MNQRLITEIGKSQRLRLVNRLKRTQGLSVGELAEALGMSYMGVKQICVELERLGYLDTWRRPKAPTQTGRLGMAASSVPRLRQRSEAADVDRRDLVYPSGDRRRDRHEGPPVASSPRLPSLDCPRT